jgi:hypothetical protein
LLEFVSKHGEQFIAKTHRFHWIDSALLSRNNFNNKTENTMKKYKYSSIGTVRYITYRWPEDDQRVLKEVQPTNYLLHSLFLKNTDQ